MTDAKGAWAKTDWTSLGTPPETVSQGQTVAMAWQATSRLPASEYRLDFIMPPEYSPDAGLEGVYSEPASFSILNTSPNDYLNARFARRVKVLAGKNDEVLGELQKLMAASNSDLSLRLELVDALDAAGRSSEAKEELQEIAYLMTHDESGKSTGPVPPWITLRLEELNARIGPDSESGSQDD
jgi:hypothetical protein